MYIFHGHISFLTNQQLKTELRDVDVCIYVYTWQRNKSNFFALTTVLSYREFFSMTYLTSDTYRTFLLMGTSDFQWNTNVG